MANKVVISAKAEVDLKSIHDYYESERPGLGAQFLQEAENIFKLIADNPHIGRDFFGEFRRSARVAEGVTADDISATYENGVLSVTITNPQDKSEGVDIKIG